MISDEYLVRKSDKSIIYQVGSSVLIDIHHIPLSFFRHLTWHGGKNVELVKCIYFFCDRTGLTDKQKNVRTKSQTIHKYTCNLKLQSK